MSKIAPLVNNRTDSKNFMIRSFQTRSYLIGQKTSHTILSLKGTVSRAAHLSCSGVCDGGGHVYWIWFGLEHCPPEEDKYGQSCQQVEKHSQTEITVCYVPACVLDFDLTPFAVSI